MSRLWGSFLRALSLCCPFRRRAAKAKEAVNIPTLAGERMNAPDIAEQAIRDGKIDAVVLGRASLADREYPNKVISARTEEIYGRRIKYAGSA